MKLRIKIILLNKVKLIRTLNKTCLPKEACSFYTNSGSCLLWRFFLSFCSVFFFFPPFHQYLSSSSPSSLFTIKVIIENHFLLLITLISKQQQKMSFIQGVVWVWSFFVFLMRGTCVAIADFWIMYVRVGKLWKRRLPPTDQDLIVQLANHSPCHSTVKPQELILHVERTRMDPSLWTGMSSAVAAPSALVTGISIGGIGFYTTLYLLLSGVNVHAVSRDATRAKLATQLLQSTLDRYSQEHPELSAKMGRIMLHHCDLSDTTAVGEVADKISTDPNLRIIVCSAGPMATPTRLTHQNLEEQFAVHHVGHSLLIMRLLQYRLKARAFSHRWRFVILSSGAASTAYPDNDTTFNEWKAVEDAEEKINRFDGYGNAKMCQLLFGLALSKCIANDERLSSCCTVNVLHPGPIRSRVLPNSGLPLLWLLDGELAAIFRLTPAIAALYVVDLALNARHAGTNGHFFRMGEDQTVHYHKLVEDPSLRGGFWQNSTLFPGIPGPSVSLSYERQNWMWQSTMHYLCDHRLLERSVFEGMAL
ncbi:hypothetical protein, conserved [Angomonas deanei]|uniref:NAD-dependent epimerase/dehydratase domain-containing protein n=1 Tax=Angomonas deanei TaxID=59799 RepID=A0A7G2CFJ5_9TRYP|nr:hypothetical protein, conserved [Angomonas deanei]